LKIEQVDKMQIENILTGKLDKEVGERIMKSVVEHWLEEGIELGEARGEAKGKAEAMESVAREMLSEGYDISSIIKLTKLDESSILALSGSNKTRQKGTRQPKHP
jgi:predicted transposase YdaD